MNDRIGSPVLQCLAKLVCVEQIAFNKIGAVNNGAAMSFAQIVVDHNFVAIFYEFFGYDTADVPRAARYKYPHAFPLEWLDRIIRYEQDLQESSRNLV